MLNLDTYIKKYFHIMKENMDSIDSKSLGGLVELILASQASNNKLIIIGNGGSASISDHLIVDFVNAAKIRAINFNNSSILTCFSNDYGYENWVDKALGYYADPGDIVILISSSGQSKNILVGASKAMSMGASVVTFSGFSSDNPLRRLGDINFWVNSNAYNIVEMTHHIWLLAIVDYIVELKNRNKR
jgi:D-sedoheptulose 7-phosphate isomerase